MSRQKSHHFLPSSDRLRLINQFDGNLVYGSKDFHQRTNRLGNSDSPATGNIIPEHRKAVIDHGHERYQLDPDRCENVDICPICGSQDKTFHLNRYGLKVFSCNHCSHKFLNPRLRFNEAVKIYESDKTASDIYTAEDQVHIDQLKYDYGLKLISHFCGQNTNKIMDIGCGAGVFLERANLLGWKQCIGIDINKRYQSFYENKPGVQYIMSSFENLNSDLLGSNYDCISLWSCLEHIYNLHDCIDKIKSLLRPGGILFVLVPNSNSLATRIIRDKSPTFAWKHVSYFNEKSLNNLMSIHGFTLLQQETIISELENIKSYLSGEHPYYGFGDPDNLFPFITPEYIHENLLGSRLISIFTH